MGASLQTHLMAQKDLFLPPSSSLLEEGQGDWSTCLCGAGHQEGGSAPDQGANNGSHKEPARSPPFRHTLLRGHRVNSVFIQGACSIFMPMLGSHKMTTLPLLMLTDLQGPQAQGCFRVSPCQSRGKQASSVRSLQALRSGPSPLLTARDLAADPTQLQSRHSKPGSATCWLHDLQQAAGPLQAQL